MAISAPQNYVESSFRHNSHPGLSLPDLIYGDGRQRMMEVMTEAEQGIEVQCRKVCAATHELYGTIRSLRTTDDAVHARIRMETLLASIHGLIALVMGDPFAGGVAAYHIHRAKSTMGESALLNELQYSEILLHTCMDALDTLIAQEPATGLDVCSDEGIPLRFCPEQLLSVNRLGLYWDYLMNRNGYDVTPDMLREKTQFQAHWLLRQIEGAQSEYQTVS